MYVIDHTAWLNIIAFLKILNNPYSLIHQHKAKQKQTTIKNFLSSSIVKAILPSELDHLVPKVIDKPHVRLLVSPNNADIVMR